MVRLWPGRACYLKTPANCAILILEMTRPAAYDSTGIQVLIPPGGSAMKRIAAIVYFALMAASGLAFAAGAPVLKVSKSVTINAPAEKVWEQTKNFSGLNTWHPAVESDKIVQGTDNKVGAVRLLTLKGGGTIQEKLLAHDDAKRTFKYSILEGVLPVSNYTSTFSVASAGKNKAKVTWSGSFQRKDTGPKPAAGADDKTAKDTIAGVYKGGLDNLKKITEAK
jgi:mxaD protein